MDWSQPPGLTSRSGRKSKLWNCLEALCGSMGVVELPTTHPFALALGQWWAEESWLEPGSLAPR
eukprot:4472922-Amphidinium_carterae.1